MAFANPNIFGITQQTDEQLARIAKEINKEVDIKKLNKQLEKISKEEQKAEMGYIRQQRIELDNKNKYLSNKINFYEDRLIKEEEDKKILMYEEQIFELDQEIKKNEKQILKFEDEIKMLQKS